MPAAAAASNGSTIASQTVINSEPPLECSDISGQISASEASSGAQEVVLNAGPPVVYQATVNDNSTIFANSGSFSDAEPFLNSKPIADGQSIIGQIPTATGGNGSLMSPSKDHVTVVKNIAVDANGGSTSSSQSLPAKLLDNCPSLNSHNTASGSKFRLSPAVSESQPPAKSTNAVDAHDFQVAKATIGQNSVTTAAKIVNFNSHDTLLARCQATSQKFNASAAANSDSTVASHGKVDFGPPEEQQASFNEHRDTVGASNGSKIASHVRMDSERLARLQESQLKLEKTVR
jgi:hypothetical protein